MNTNWQKAEARRLWEACFNDEKTFVDFYFERIYPTAENYLLHDPDKPAVAIAQMQVIPYQYRLWGQRMKAGYISGACTDAAYRGRGLMQQMLAKALQDMYDAGYELSFLIPAEAWLFDFYRQKAGYQTSVAKRYESRSQSPIDLAPYRLVEDEASYPFYINFVSQPDSWMLVQHSEYQWRAALEDMRLAGGKQLTLFDEEDRRLAEAYYLPEAGKMALRLLIGAEEYARILLQALMQKLGVNELILPARPDEHSEPYAMLRPVRVLDLLRHYAQAEPQLQRSFALIDRQLMANTGRYTIAQGKASFRPDRSLSEGLSIAELSEQILPQFKSSTVLMMD